MLIVNLHKASDPIIEEDNFYPAYHITHVYKTKYKPHINS